MKADLMQRLTKETNVWSFTITPAEPDIIEVETKFAHKGESDDLH